MAGWIRRTGTGLAVLLVLLGAGWAVIGPDWRALLKTPRLAGMSCSGARRSGMPGSG